MKGEDKAPARGMLLRFAFPMPCEGWQWHDDMQTARRIRSPQVFENVRGLRVWPDLPEWADQPALKMGYSNRNFCTVLTGPVALCLAVRLDRPCIARSAYDASAGQLQIIFDFALSPDTREPNAASFDFDLYAIDPAWGFRSALARYYELHPAMFAVCVQEPGMWMPFTRLSHVDNANEFLFGLLEGPREPAYDDRIGVLDCTYFIHAGISVRLPDHDSENDPLPPHQVQVDAVESAFRRETGMDDLYRQVGLHDAAGRLDVRKWQVYGDLIAQFNLDPELPYGRWQLERTARETQEMMTKRGGRLDGFYYDGLPTGVNYRRDHFRYSTAPPLWDPVNAKPFLNNFFSSCECARAAAEALRPRGQITMMNGTLNASFYVAPWLDVLGEETGLRISREELNFIRAATYHKPFLTLLKGNYEQEIGRAEIERYMQRALAYGILPGFFDWGPSGLGRGGRYWEHPEYFERDRDLFRTYLPLARTLAAAGWEPLTYARSSNEKVFVERFGPDRHGIVWLTLLNESARPQRTTLVLDAGRLELDPAGRGCVDVLTRKAVRFDAADEQLAADLELDADGVAMLRWCSARTAAVWELEWALDTVARGILMREIDRGKLPRAVHWRPAVGHYQREAGADGYAVVLDGNGRGSQTCWQWAMLFQPGPAPVTLRVRAAPENLAGDGACGIRAAVTWVSKRFTHYEEHFLDLPKGTYAYRDFELNLECEHPVRAITVEPQVLKGGTGKLKIASVRLSDAFGADYVVDPEFGQWYEPVPQRMRKKLAQDSVALRDAVARASQAAGANLRSDATHEALLTIGGICTRLRRWIAAERAENGCRRVLRDVETTEQHAGLALLAALGATMPALAGPARAAPGDDVRLTFAVPAVDDVPVETQFFCAGGTRVRRTDNGAALTVPADAKPGTALAVVGKILLGPRAGVLTLRSAHRIEVIPPLTLALAAGGTDPQTGALRVRAHVRNNRTRPLTTTLDLSAPAGWQAEAADVVTVPAGASIERVLHAFPERATPVSPVAMTATASSGDDVAAASATLLYVPREANLLRGKSGTVWFDDAAVAEDPRRRGNIAREADVTVDSFYSGYDAVPINDGILYPAESAHWADESWASGEAARDHFIEMAFDEPRQIERVTLHWSLDGGIPRTPVEAQMQVPDGDGWRTVAVARPVAAAAATSMRMPTAVTAHAFRILQPAGKGPAGRPHLMWVREVELFPPED